MRRDEFINRVANVLPKQDEIKRNFVQIERKLTKCRFVWSLLLEQKQGKGYPLSEDFVERFL